MSGSFGSEFEKLHAIAQRSLESNIIEVQGAHGEKSLKALRAGGHQFQALWTRDFCFSVGGLAQIKRFDVIEDHLRLILKHLRKQDGLAPKYFDSVPILWRYVLLFFNIVKPVKGLPKPGYSAGIPPSLGVDANALVVLAAKKLCDLSGNRALWNELLPDLKRAMHYYSTVLEDHLIVQPKFSDWQDSVSREGRTLYLNALYLAALKALDPDDPVISKQIVQTLRSVETVFRDPASGLFQAVSGFAHIGLECHLILLDYDILDSKTSGELYQKLKASHLWSQTTLPGVPTFPNYPNSQVAWIVRAVGVRHYHDWMVWSWLAGYCAKIARKMGDDTEAKRILRELTRIAERDGEICEIYRPSEKLEPFKAWMYSSERPFSWGAAMILEALR